MSDIRLTGKMVSFSRLTINTSDFARINSSLKDLLGQDGANQGLPVLIDSTVDIDLHVLLRHLRAQGLQVMGVVDGQLGQQARALDMTVLPADRPMQRIQPSEPAPATATQAASITQPIAEPAATLLHHEVLRTGQRLVAEHGDIVLTTDMNSGSELIAMGSVHVYGTLRGRVIAGAAGQDTARIFCQRLEAELVSIAGTYCVADDIPPNMIGKAVRISLNSQGELNFQPLHGIA
jgi:septum site-determining protein MinC